MGFSSPAAISLCTSRLTVRSAPLAFVLCFLRHQALALVLLVGETLADDATEQTVGAIRVVAAERDAVGIAEIELGQIAVKCFSAQC